MIQRVVAARLALIVVACATSVLAFGRLANAQAGANVLVVINSASLASETIGRAYAARRGVSADNLCTIPLPLSASITRAVYYPLLEQPIWTCIAARRSPHRII